MDGLKLKAEEKLEALQLAAGHSKTRVQDVLSHTLEAIRKIRSSFRDVWDHELISESRARVAAWARDAVQRIKEGAPPLSPVLLYEELKALFKDRVWRRSMCIFVCGVCVGGCVGLAAGLRAGAVAPHGPHARALHAHADHGVMLVDDALTRGCGTGEVLVRVRAFSVCAADRAVLRGLGAALRALLGRPPVIVGRGFAGVILDVGYGVTELELGDEVWGCVSEWSGGAAAELLTVRSTRVSKRPLSLSAESAAAGPRAAAVALAALRRRRHRADTCKGKRVLVCGSGGECCAGAQLLAAWGAHVSVLAPPAAARAMLDLGAHEVLEGAHSHAAVSWATAERHAALGGPWDCVLCGDGAPPALPLQPRVLLKATAPTSAIVDLRPKAYMSDRLPAPLSLVFAAGFYSFRTLRWLGGCGTHTDWMEDQFTLRDGLTTIAQLVEAGQLVPVLDKVYLPQEFESALAHACGDAAAGTTVVRFP